MATIPKPFIGGSEQPERDRRAASELAEPFSPEVAERTAGHTPEETALPPPAGSAPGEAVRAARSRDWEEPEPLDYPDYLFGADGGGAGEALAEEPELGSEALPEEMAERLARVARELLEGDEGELIRKLIADLSSLAADIAVPRAFAAGFLAARERQGD